MKIKAIFTLFLFLGTQVVWGQEQAGGWDKWQFLIGEWVGVANGQPGSGSGRFSFNPDLNGNIMVRKSHTDFPAINNRPAFSHDDLLIVYKNSSGAPSQAIYFDNENHTINYEIAYSENSVILTSEPIQNVPRFRLTYEKLDDKKLNVRFEMTSPKNPEVFKLYLEGQSVRK
jgi:hypothetical protein